jgi:hypothetical protein
MDLATKLLEDQEFIIQFLQKSQKGLLQSRLLAEKLLAQAGINYYQQGQVTDDTDYNESKALQPKQLVQCT